MNKKLITTMALVAAAVGSFAQSAVSTAGYEATGDGTVSATIGQVAYLTATGDGGSIAQGVQQAFEITTETGIEITEIQLSAYPNPTSDVLNLKIDGDFGTVTYALYNNSSALVTKGTANGSETQIQMGAYKPGVYFLEVKMDGKAKKFKVVRN